MCKFDVYVYGSSCFFYFLLLKILSVTDPRRKLSHLYIVDQSEGIEIALKQ